MSFGGQMGGGGDFGGGDKSGYGQGSGDDSGRFQLPEDQTGPGPSAGTKAYIGEVDGVQVFYWKYDDNPSLYTARNAEAEAKAAAMLKASSQHDTDIKWSVYHLSMEDVKTLIRSGTENIATEITVLPDTGPVIEPEQPTDWGDLPLKLLIIGGIVAVAIWFLFIKGRPAPAMPALPAGPAVASIPVPIPEAKI